MRRVRGVVEGGLIRLLYPRFLREGIEVEVLLPEHEVDEAELARRQKVWEAYQKLEKIDIRPMTTEQIVREDRESH